MIQILSIVDVVIQLTISFLTNIINTKRRGKTNAGWAITIAK